MWIDPINGAVAHTTEDIRALRPNWSGPMVMTDDMILTLGFKVVTLVTPEYDAKTQRVVEMPPSLSNGEYSQHWEVVPLTSEEQEAARKASVPTTVTRRQARQALLLNDLLKNVQPAIDAIPDTLQRGMAQIEWDDATDFERTRPLVVQIGAAIGLDDVGLDNIFIQAAGL